MEVRPSLISIPRRHYSGLLSPPPADASSPRARSLSWSRLKILVINHRASTPPFFLSPPPPLDIGFVYWLSSSAMAGGKRGRLRGQLNISILQRSGSTSRSQSRQIIQNVPKASRSNEINEIVPTRSGSKPRNLKPGEKEIQQSMRKEPQRISSYASLVNPKEGNALHLFQPWKSMDRNVRKY